MTEWDKVFLEKLKRLMDSGDLWVGLKPGEASHVILKGTYGDKNSQFDRISLRGALTTRLQLDGSLSANSAKMAFSQAIYHQ